MDRTLLKELKQVSQMLKHLAKQAGSAAHLQMLAAKECVFEGKITIGAEVVFLTEKEENESIAKIQDWIGMKKKPSPEEFFNGKINGTMPVSKDIMLNMQVYHFDHYPEPKLSEEKKALKIIIYDPGYEAGYKNWNLAQEMLGKDAAVCLIINISPQERIAPEESFQIENTEVKHLTPEHLEAPFINWLEGETFLRNIQLARLKNHIAYLEKIYRLITEGIYKKTRQLQGKSMLAHKKQWQIQQKSAGLSSKDNANIKADITTNLKKITKTIEQAIDNFDKEDTGYITLEKEILSFIGFVEEKSGKYLTFRMAEGAVQDKVNGANEALSSFFTTVTGTVNQQFNAAVSRVKDQLVGWNLKASGKLAPTPAIETAKKEFLLDESVTSEKTYEKQVPSKGIGSLLMELRTPLFMLMPFMMMFGLFGALVKGGSKGEISTDQFHNGKPALIITNLPESWENPNEFVEEVDKERKKGNFYKMISDGKNLTPEAQLATVTKEEPKSYGSGTTLVEKLDAHIDPDTKVVYLYLMPNADREHVKSKLLDPNAELLAASASGRRTGVGIGGLIRLMSRLSEYRYLILVGLTGLICWFVITRKRSMSRELTTAKEKEQRKLNEDLKQHISKNIKQQLQRWKADLFEQLGSRQAALQQATEQLISDAITNKKRQKEQEYKIIQQRMLAIKSEKSLVTSLKTEQRKTEVKLKELLTKTGRLK